MSFWTPVENLGTRPPRSWVFDIGCALLAAVASSLKPWPASSTPSRSSRSPRARAVTASTTPSPARAAAVDAFVLGVSTRRRVLRCDLGDVGDLQGWLGGTIQRLVDDS